MTRLRGTLTAAAVPLILLSACAQAAGSGATGVAASDASASQGADTLVLRAERLGGFVPADLTVGRLPMVSVYGDGRVVTDGPVNLMAPGPALPNVQVQMITPELVRQLAKEAAAAGVRTGTDFGRPNVADAPSTRVTVSTGGATQTVTVEALGEAQSNDPSLTAAQRDARTKLAAYVTKVTGLSTATGMPAPSAYVPDAVAVLAHPFAPAGDLKSPEMAWAGPALPGEMVNENIGMGCVVVTGTQKDQVLAAAKKATAITPWTAGGKKWLIKFRPLLPDEKGCAALKGDR
jgi:hypothetical protein